MQLFQLWAVADPILRSVTHTRGAKIVTDRTVPKFGDAFRSRQHRLRDDQHGQGFEYAASAAAFELVAFPIQ